MKSSFCTWLISLKIMTFNFIQKRVLLGETGKEKLPYHCRNIGLGFKTPSEATEGTEVDKKCTCTRNVTEMKPQRRGITHPAHLLYTHKYNYFEKPHKNVSIHLCPCFGDVQSRDIGTVGAYQPLSKTVCFKVFKVTKTAGTKKQFQKLDGMPTTAPK
uniref:Small ribosomal subunit protein uS17 n=1 Tax=Oryctolagus cuniculus TaxID=9986 RepID=A0A5F9D3L0_RABIT